MMANLRLVLDVEVQPGNQTQSAYSAPGLLALLDRLPEHSRPVFVRGDCDWGSGPIMSSLEEKDTRFLFKLKKSGNVKVLINKHHCLGGWTLFKSGWEAKEDKIQLQGWLELRRVVIVRRRVEKENTLVLEGKKNDQQSLAFVDGPEDLKLYEYSVLITSLEDDIIAIVQHYRDRADCENIFDELKNQWGWGGYTTKDLKSCRFMARMIALIYNWWSLFVRMVNPDSGGHQEAITSRPLLLTGVGRLTTSGRQKTMTITSHDGRGNKVCALFQKLSHYFNELKAIAPQLDPLACWHRMLDKIASTILQNKGRGPPLLTASAP